MKFSYKTLIAVIPAFVTAACGGGADTPDPNPIQPTDKKIEISINPSMTRATDFGFETGDAVGLYVVNYSGATPGTLTSTDNYVDNMRFTYNGSWIPDSPVVWNDNETHADFYLYYPFTNVQNVTAHPFAVNADQSAEESYKASDFMVGRTLDVAPTDRSIQIPVSHVMSRIQIYLEAGNGFTAESLSAADILIKINGIRCHSAINIATGDVTPTGEASTLTPLLTDNCYKALIVPQTVEEGNLITVSVDGRDFNLKKGFTFESEKSHKFTITLSKTSAGVNVNINPWIEDGTDNGGTAE